VTAGVHGRHHYSFHSKLAASVASIAAETSIERMFRSLFVTGGARVGRLYSNAKIFFQSLFMLTTVQPFAFASSSALSSRPIDDFRS
jgi:hypothetical protein